MTLPQLPYNSNFHLLANAFYVAKILSPSALSGTQGVDPRHHMSTNTRVLLSMPLTKPQLHLNTMTPYQNKHRHASIPHTIILRRIGTFRAGWSVSQVQHIEVIRHNEAILRVVPWRCDKPLTSLRVDTQIFVNEETIVIREK